MQSTLLFMLYFMTNLMEIYTSCVCKNKKHWNNLRCKNPPPLIFTKNLFCLETKKNHQLHSNKMAIVFVRGAHNVFMWFFAYTLWLILQPCRMIYEFASVLRNLNTILPCFSQSTCFFYFYYFQFLQQNLPTPKSRFSILLMDR